MTSKANKGARSGETRFQRELAREVSETSGRWWKKSRQGANRSIGPDYRRAFHLVSLPFRLPLRTPVTLQSTRRNAPLARDMRERKILARSLVSRRERREISSSDTRGISADFGIEEFRNIFPEIYNSQGYSARVRKQPLSSRRAFYLGYRSARSVIMHTFRENKYLSVSPGGWIAVLPREHRSAGKSEEIQRARGSGRGSIDGENRARIERSAMIGRMAEGDYTGSISAGVEIYITGGQHARY